MSKPSKSSHDSRRLPDVAGSTVEVVIERILPGGMGMAHAEGKTLLVALSAPGDRLLVRREGRRGGVAFASIVEVIEPSRVRVDPSCPYFGRCGGCDFQQLKYAAQLDAKIEIIRDCLRRIARIDFSGPLTITPSPSVWNYRARAEWQYDARKNHLGYFERGSHTVCDVAVCPVLEPALGETLGILRARMHEGTLQSTTAEFHAVAGAENVSVLPAIDADGTRVLSREIVGNRYFFGADGFFQINQKLLPALIEAALGRAQGGTAIDLYCGVGLFTLPLARVFKEVIGVEAHPTAVSYARRNLETAELQNARIYHSLVREWMDAHAATYSGVDFLLLDPPRTGAEAGVIDAIVTMRPQHISYVSCDPATLARDLKGLSEGGYRLDSISAFDMFPQTHHVETIVHLDLGP